MADTATQLPTADDILGTEQPKEAANSNQPQQSVDDILSTAKAPAPAFMQPVIGALKTVGAVDSIAKAFGHSFIEAEKEGGIPGESPDFEKAMDDNHLTAFQAFVRPAAATIEGTMRTMGAAYAGFQSAAVQAGQVAGFPSLGRDIAIAPEAMMAFHMPEPVVRGVANDATLSDEVYFGTKQKTPQQVAASYQATQALFAKEDYMAAQKNLVNAAQGPSIHDIVRESQPELFNEKDRLETRQAVLRDSFNNPDVTFGKEYDNKLTELKEQQAISTRVPVGLEGDELQKAVAESNRKGAEVDQRIRDLGSRDDYIKDAADKAREEHTNNMHRLAEISTDPRIRAAYQEAGQKLKQWEPPQPEVAAPIIAPEAKEIKGPWETAQEQPSGKPIEEQHKAIVDDIVKKATAKGYGEEEAKASAEILARQYRYLSDVYGGSKGTAEDFYNQYKPEIIGQRERVGKAKELQSVSGRYHVTEDGRRIIRLMDSADESTLIHEGAHHFMDMMKRFEAEADAPAQLKADMDMLRKELGVGRNGIFRTIHEERFARGFETYLREGHAPSIELVPLFQKFEKWITDIYNTIKNLPKVEISDAVRNFFDRTLEPNSALRNNPRNTVIAKAEPGKAISNIHKADSKTTPPEHADRVADNIEKEIDATVNLHNPEIKDALTNAEQAGGVPETSTGNSAVGAAAQPAGGGQGAPQEHGAVAAGGGGTPAKSPWARGKSEPVGIPTTDDEPANPNARLPKSKTDLVDKAGNIRLDLLNTTEDIDAALREVADENEGFTAQRRGVIPNSVTLDLADALGLDPSHLDMKTIGQATNAEGIVARVKLLIQSAKETSDAAKSGDVNAYLEAKERQKMIQGHVSGITAEAGRALQIFQSLKNMEGYDEATALSNFLKENDKGKTLNQLQEEMAFAAKLNTTQQVAKFVQDSSRSGFSEAVRFYYVNALLSGPITHMHYAVGNAVMALWTPLVRIPIAATVGEAREAITGKINTDRVYMGESGSQLYAIGKGSRDGLMAAIESFKTGQMPGRAGSLMNTKLSSPSANPIGGLTGQILGIPTKSVQAIHSFFYTVRYEQNIAGMAYREAMKSGLEGEDFNAKVAQLTKSPTEEMVNAAGKDALKELYMEPGEYDSFKAKIARATDSNLAAKIVVPFAKVGMNITSNAWIDQSLLGLFNKDIRANLSGENGGAVRDMQIAKIAAGTALMGTTAMMASEGMITGDGPNDPAQRAVWLLTHKPNHITIGDVSIPYKGLGSLAMLIRFSANMTETAQAWDSDDGDKLAVSAVQGLTSSVLDETFMLGVKNMVDAAYHPVEYGPRYLQSFATNWLPFSVGMGQTSREIDPYQREVRSHGMENAWGIIDAARDRIPFASEGLQPRVDMFGNPIKNGSTYDQYKDDPVVQKLEELHMGIGRLERKITNVPLTDVQYHDYAQLAGQLTKQNLNAIVNEQFSELPKEIQVEQIHKAVASARANARSIIKMEYMGSDNDIVQKASEMKEKLLH